MHARLHGRGGCLLPLAYLDSICLVGIVVHHHHAARQGLGIYTNLATYMRYVTLGHVHRDHA